MSRRRYSAIIALLTKAMQQRSVEGLQGALEEAERLELECVEVSEARAMLQMATFEEETTHRASMPRQDPRLHSRPF